MSKIDKKKAKLVERIQQLEAELKLSLHQKTVGKEISVPEYTRKIQELKMQLASM